jgi:hypothetical protein
MSFEFKFKIRGRPNICNFINRGTKIADIKTGDQNCGFNKTRGPKLHLRKKRYIGIQSGSSAATMSTANHAATYLPFDSMIY